jgi:hypothetical protein
MVSAAQCQLPRRPERFRRCVDLVFRLTYSACGHRTPLVLAVHAELRRIIAHILVQEHGRNSWTHKLMPDET